MKRFTTLAGTALLLGLASSAHAAVVISSTLGNGGFTNGTSGVNVSSITGWTSSNPFWVDAGNSTLTSAPFGSDSGATSHFVQLHNDAGSILTSTTLFSVTTGDSVLLSFDYKTAGTGGDTTLTIELVDTDSNTTFATFGTLSTATNASAGFLQLDFSTLALSSENNLALRFTISDPPAVGKDFHLDRVSLSVVPEPSAVALCGLLPLGLLARRRR